MCGFVGFLGEPGALGADALERLAARMAARLESRGPDDAGTWVSPSAGIALGQRRLAVIDLSATGHQPMVSATGRSVIAYNGEVYNFAEIRRALEAENHRFRGGSDTEVILEACEAWGVRRTVPKLIGMFAFAFWDARTRHLTLVRDRLGIKPLYWGRSGGVLFFGSQLKGFVDHPAWRPEVDRDALAAYLRHSYVPAPRSIFTGIEKLEPGCLIEIDASGKETRERYWDLRTIARDAVRARVSLDDTAAVEELDLLLRDAVKRRMVADVPLGAFLSGGIDSSTVLALMQSQSDRPVKSFSIGFDEAGYDEAYHAKRVAAHLGTDHTELYVAPDQARAVLPGIATWFDEPFADSSQIPTYLVSEMTRRHATVALSGDGGDELFAGYDRYRWAELLSRRIAGWPSPFRATLAALLRGVSPAAWDGLARAIPRSVRPPLVGDKAHKLAALLSVADQGALYRRLVTQWETPDGMVHGGHEPHGILWDPTVQTDIPEFTDRMQFLDTVTYLPDDILTKVDRASMAVGLEARVPLLDHRVVEFSWQLPAAMKVRNGQGKWLLRQVLRKYVPQQLTDRPKMGFGVPIDRWLRKPLREWAEDLLAEERLRRTGYFEPAPIRAAWAEHLSGVRNQQYRIWTVLMFESWRETWGIGGA